MNRHQSIEDLGYMSSLMKNLFYSSILTVGNLLFPLIVFVYVSRIVGPENLGKVSFTSTISNYFILFGSFGLGTYGVREIARSRQDRKEQKKIFNELFVINCITVGVSTLAYIITAVLLKRKHDYSVLLFINGISVFLNMFSFDWFFQGVENYRYISIRSLFIKFICLIFVIFLVKKGDDYYYYAAILVVGSSANYIFNAYYANKIIGFSLYNLNLSRHIPSLFRFGLITLAASLYSGMDKVILGFFSGDLSVGLYTPAEKIIRLSLSIIMAFSSVMYSRVSHLYANSDENAATSFLSLSLHSIAILAIPILVGIELLAEPLIRILAGAQYIQSIATLRIYALIIIPVSCASVFGYQILIGRGEEAKYFLSIILGALAFASSAIFTVPAFRQNGAAMSLLIAEVVGVLSQLFFAWRAVGHIKIGDWIVPIVMSSTAMAIIVAGIANISYSVLYFSLSVVAGVLVYFSLLYLFRDTVVINVSNKLITGIRHRVDRMNRR
jgi:O-antigen/teichoic acid export membrane protein